MISKLSKQHFFLLILNFYELRLLPKIVYNMNDYGKHEC